MAIINLFTIIGQTHMTDTTRVDNLAQLLMKGGVIMVPIVLLSVLSIYLFIERYLYIRKASRMDAVMMRNILDELKGHNPENALIHAQNNQASIGRILESGLSQAGKPVKEVENFMESTTNLEISMMEKDTGYLGIIAGVAPMLGFVGTISGVIKIFYNISLADNISIGIIAGGLYQKMICSGTGLIVGVIAYCGYHYLQMMIDRFSIDLQKQVIQITKVL
jgi:biopolymer transport protein ExbB